MITRPLDLTSKLRPEPRNFDFLFFVNIGLLVLAFYLFGSRFVLAPGLGVDFRLPDIPGARLGAIQTTHSITVMASGLIYIEDGSADLERLGNWLRDKATDTRKRSLQPALLIIASDKVPLRLMTEIYKAAHAAGFVVQQAVEEPTAEKR